MDISVLDEKEFWFKDTLKVEQLINILKKYPKDMKVMITWESTVNEIKAHNIYESHTGSLYLDADGNSYKNDYAKNPKENEMKKNEK